jgi:hypothetical protein
MPWYPILNATNRIYTFTPTADDVDVPLRCVATNSEGSATSNECTLTDLFVSSLSFDDETLSFNAEALSFTE